MKRLVVGAHYGLGSWLAQRITAVVIAVYCLIAAGIALTSTPLNYTVWRDLFAQGWMRVATLVFAVSVVWHTWVGIRDILMDYIKPDGLRLTLQVVVLLVLAGYLGWAVQILFR